MLTTEKLKELTGVEWVQGDKGELQGAGANLLDDGLVAQIVVAHISGEMYAVQMTESDTGQVRGGVHPEQEVVWFVVSIFTGICPCEKCMASRVVH